MSEVVEKKLKKSKSRTDNSRKNFVTAVFEQLLVLALGFVCRTVFINTLGKQYLGLNGLFSSITTLLSLSELGIGTAIIYNLYQPLAVQDEKRIYVLMKFYKLAYRIIGLAVVVLGMFLYPFIPYIIKNPPTFINMYLVYSLYLAQSVSSYFFFAYKSSIIRANQQAYILSSTNWWFTLGLNVAQIVSLIYYPNFELYVSLAILSNILQNIYIGRTSDKMFPYINNKSDDKISWEETKNILKDCYALSLWKVYSVIISSTDNLVLSFFDGLEAVGLHSNYQLIRLNLGRLLSTFFTSITASIGNLNAVNKERNLEIFYVVNFITVVMHGIASLGFYFVASSFVLLWLSADYVISNFAVLLISIDLFILGINRLNATFRTALGLFNHHKYRPMIGAVINLSADVVLIGQFGMGIAGDVLGTILGNVVVYTLFEPQIVFKHGFGQSTKTYYLKNVVYVGLLLAIGFFIQWVVSFLRTNILLSLLAGGTLSVVIPIIVFTVIYWRSKEMEFIKLNLVPKLFKR